MPISQALEQHNTLVLAHPYHRLVGLELVHQQPGKAWCRFEVNANSANLSGMLHAGVLYGLMDVTGYLALLPMLNDDEQASTVDLHVSLVRTAPVGARIALRADVIRRSPNLAFLRCEAQTVEGALGTIATAAVTQAISRGNLG